MACQQAVCRAACTAGPASSRFHGSDIGPARAEAKDPTAPGTGPGEQPGALRPLLLVVMTIRAGQEQPQPSVQPQPEPQPQPVQAVAEITRVCSFCFTQLPLARTAGLTLSLGSGELPRI